MVQLVFPEVTRALLLVTDLALLPCGPSALDLRAAHDAIRVVQQAQMIRKRPPRTFLLPNKVQSNYRLSRELLETADTLGIPTPQSAEVATSVMPMRRPRDRGLAVTWNQRGRRRNQRIIQADRPL
jgi:cellulose biosynthesis protein BcsQ